jgi:starch-binding outer membrane protein, SusD/RagB family
MNMKKLTIILVGTFLVLGLQSCTDWLSIRPESEVVLEDYWQTESQATSVLSSCYRGLITNECIERMIVWGELRSDNMVSGAVINENLYKIINVDVTPTNAYADWGSFYKVINYCNTFLHYAPGVVSKDQNYTVTKLHVNEAEAKAIRALCYFYLVRSFHEVPLVLTPSIDDTQDYNVPKSTEREILDQIIMDLTEAQQYAKASYGKEAYNKGRMTLSSIDAILADVYLWDQQYANCVTMCEKVMEDKTLSLVDADKFVPEVFYKGNSTESILELQFDKDVQMNNTINNFYGINGGTFGIYGELSYAAYLSKKGTYSPFNFSAPTSSVKESVTDLRQSYFIGDGANYADGNGYCIFKYALTQCTLDANQTATPSYRNFSTTANWILYRLSDVMLMKAEALVELNRTTDDLKTALRLVNTTYLRSNTTVDSLLYNNYNTKEALESLVLRERQRELLFEGKRWYDLLRMVRRKEDASAILAYLSPKLTGSNMQFKKMSVMNALYMPILKSELERNANLTQNPFYLDSNFTSN